MKKYCIMPFASVRIEDSANKNSTKVRPCCFYRSDSEKFDSADEYLNSDFLAKLQKHFLVEDELPSGCATCAKSEKEGQVSIRQQKNKFFPNPLPTSTQIRELDIFVSNVCNLTCIMCNPKFSSAVAAEQKKLGLIEKVYNFDDTDFALDTLSSLSDLTHVSIAGGEFFYAKRHKEILQSIITKGIENVKITSNGTIFDKEIVNLLSAIPKLQLRFSIDGVAEAYEFVRYPAKWNEVKNNIKQYQLCLPNAKFETNFVVQPFTLKSIFDWIDFANDNDLETHWINILGQNLSWSMLTDAERKLSSIFLYENLPNRRLTNLQKLFVLNFARSTLPLTQFNEDERKSSIMKLVAMCKIRRIDIESIIPMIDIWPKLTEDIRNQVHR